MCRHVSGALRHSKLYREGCNICLAEVGNMLTAKDQSLFQLLLPTASGHISVSLDLQRKPHPRMPEHVNSTVLLNVQVAERTGLSGAAVAPRSSMTRVTQQWFVAVRTIGLQRLNFSHVLSFVRNAKLVLSHNLCNRPRVRA
jgi:hypothetical protein